MPQRGSVLQPKVARVREGYLGYQRTNITNPNGVAACEAWQEAATPLGLEIIIIVIPG